MSLRPRLRNALHFAFDLFDICMFLAVVALIYLVFMDPQTLREMLGRLV